MQGTHLRGRLIADQLPEGAPQHRRLLLVRRDDADGVYSGRRLSRLQEGAELLEERRRQVRFRLVRGQGQGVGLQVGVRAGVSWCPCEGHSQAMLRVKANVRVGVSECSCTGQGQSCSRGQGQGQGKSHGRSVLSWLRLRCTGRGHVDAKPP